MITKKAISLCLSCYFESIQHVWLVLLDGVLDYSWNTGRLGTGIVGIAFIHISVIWFLIQGLPGGLAGADYRKPTCGLSAWDSLKHGGWVERANYQAELFSWPRLSSHIASLQPYSIVPSRHEFLSRFKRNASYIVGMNAHIGVGIFAKYNLSHIPSCLAVFWLVSSVFLGL